MIRYTFAIVLLLAASAKAQTFYEPVQIQYATANGQPFCYGGVDARVFAAADRAACLDASSQRVAYPFIQAWMPVLPVSPGPRVYGDWRGWLGYQSGTMTVDDATNKANASVPRYIRMAEQRGIALVDGSVVVPIRPVMGPGTIEIKPYVRPGRTTTSPILIIPKGVLIPSKSSDKTVAVGP